MAPVDLRVPATADQASALAGSVHADGKEHPCTSCHGDAHSIFPKGDARSAVYALNIPKTCGNCHGNAAMAKKHNLPNVYPLYMDSIHGFALSKEGLLVAANCQSCHGSHHILSHKDPASPTYKTNIPNTSGSCHAQINTDYHAGVHGHAVAAGKLNAPVCTSAATRRMPSGGAYGISLPACSPRRYAAAAIRIKVRNLYSRHLPLAALGSLGSYA